MWSDFNSTPPHLLTFDLLNSEIMTLHRVTPALAAASACKWRSLGARAQVGRGQSSSLCAKTDGALWKEQSV